MKNTWELGITNNCSLGINDVWELGMNNVRIIFYNGSDSKATSTSLLSPFVVKLGVTNGKGRPGFGMIRLTRLSRQSVCALRFTTICASLVSLTGSFGQPRIPTRRLRKMQRVWVQKQIASRTKFADVNLKGPEIHRMAKQMRRENQDVCGFFSVKICRGRTRIRFRSKFYFCFQ